jgi:membrane-associated phospholipid phosphatase
MKLIQLGQMQKLRTAPVLSRVDLALTLVPALAWAGLVHARAHLITPHCITHPLQCMSANLFKMDQASLGLVFPLADSWSFQTQYAAAWMATLIPLLWTIVRKFREKLPAPEAGRIAAVDLLLFLQTTIWNGLLTEAIRITIQRPRPFVYLDPANLGNNPAHYTSFVSGHTSFAAAAGTALVLILLSRKAPFWLLALSGAIGALLTVFTGLFRVMAGRHFATDVIFAVFAGVLAAYCVARIHRPASRRLLPLGPIEV